MSMFSLIMETSRWEEHLAHRGPQRQKGTTFPAHYIQRSGELNIQRERFSRGAVMGLLDGIWCLIPMNYFRTFYGFILDF